MAAEIHVPELGESVVEARVARWLKKEGDPVSVGEPVVELETDKIDLEVGASQDGVLARIARGDGEDVKIGELLGVIEPAAAPGHAAAAPAETPATTEAAAKAEADATEPSAPAAEEEAARDKPRATPTAQRLAREHQVDLAAVRGSGDSGRVTRQDVESYVKEQAARRPEAAEAREPAERPSPAPAARPAPRPGAPAAAPAAPAPAGERVEERVRMSKRRATIARRLVEAQRAAAMLTTFNEADMTAIMTLRQRHKEAFRERYGVSLGIASFFVRASIAALKAFPRLNAEVQGDEMIIKRYYDIGIAVGAAEGLVVPVLRDADRMPLAAIEQGIRSFARKAEDGTLTLEDLRGGTFTITNGGVFGSLMSTPILNPPQVGILGLHKIQDRAVPAGGQVAVRPMMYVALSYDHRIVDGMEAVQFLVRVKAYIEEPASLLFEG